MSNNDFPASPDPGQQWAGLERDDPNSDLFAAVSPTGILLCRSCRPLQRCRLGIARETLHDDGTVHSDITCPPDHEGGPDVAHGGWTAGVLDELSGHALLLRDEFAVTGQLHVTFLKPIPIQRNLSGIATITARSGREIHVDVDLRLADADQLVATSHAVMIRRAANHFARHRQWLDELTPPGAP